jgi:hypothetical protein
MTRCTTERAIAREKYAKQKYLAKKRGIDWQFDFDSWLKLWMESGKWEMRGSGRGKYVMARKGDLGPYSVENVEIILGEKNSRDMHLNYPNPNPHGGLGEGRGWRKHPDGKLRPYQAHLGTKSLGYYATPEEAHAVYVAAAQEVKRLRAEHNEKILRARQPVIQPVSQ